MPNSAATRVLVVAHKTAATQPLLDAVHARAARGACVFTLLVPNATHGLHKVVDPEDQSASEAQNVLERALPVLRDAAGAPVEGILGDADPMAAVQDAVNLRGFDEVIVSTLSPRVSRWLRLDLPSKVAGLGLPVTTVTPADADEAEAPDPDGTDGADGTDGTDEAADSDAARAAHRDVAQT
jgi:hypothetical protein